MRKKILFLILSGFLSLPLLALADGASGVTIQGMVDAAVNTTLYIASGVVVLWWVLTGILFLSAQGAPEKVTSAKHALIAAVAGTVVVIVAWSAIPLVRSMFGLNSGS